MNPIPSLFRPDSRRQLAVWLAALGLLLAAVILFLELAEDIWLNEGFGWDTTLMLRLHSLGRPGLDRLFRLITETAGPLIAMPAGITAFWFWRRGERSTAILFLVTFAGAVLLNTVLKLVFARPRPNVFPPLVVESSYSFPSGHTMSAIAFYGLLVLHLWQRERWGWAVCAGIWVPLVATSRVYLGAHYPSDVLASLAVGTVWLVIVWFTSTGRHVSQPPTNGYAPGRDKAEPEPSADERLPG